MRVGVNNSGTKELVQAPLFDCPGPSIGLEFDVDSFGDQPDARGNAVVDGQVAG